MSSILERFITRKTPPETPTSHTVEFVKRGKRLVAYYPQEKTIFPNDDISGNNGRDLANAVYHAQAVVMGDIVEITVTTDQQKQVVTQQLMYGEPGTLTDTSATHAFLPLEPTPNMQRIDIDGIVGWKKVGRVDLSTWVPQTQALNPQLATG